MSRSAIYYWAPSDGNGYQNGIARIQSAQIGDNLVLVSNTTNGVFSYINTVNPYTSTTGVSSDVIRSISFTSGPSISNTGVRFVINGIGTPIDGEGNPTRVIGPISETVTGPDVISTVTSANIYTEIGRAHV